jgi:hypothetical protein
MPLEEKDLNLQAFWMKLKHPSSQIQCDSTEAQLRLIFVAK